MSFRDSRHLAIRAFLLASFVICSALPVRAIPLDAGAGFRGDRAIFTGFLNELRRVWAGLWDSNGLSNVFSKNGMLIDPNGAPAPPNPTTDEGMLIDPHG